jgi:hypothetical protein
MNMGNIIQNFNYNDNNNNKFYQNNNNNNHNNRNTLNNKGSYSMQGLKNTMPNFNLNENLNFSMFQGNNQQLLNNRNNQRGFYNQQNYMNGNMVHNNLPNSSKMMRNEKIINSFQQKENKLGNNMKKNQKQYNNSNLMSQEIKNKNNNYKQQNLKNKSMYKPNYIQNLDDQGVKNNINNNNQNVSIDNSNNNLKTNSPSLILNLKVDKDKYEIFHLNLHENPILFFQELQKRIIINENMFIFLYKKIRDIMDKSEKIFGETLNKNSSNDLKDIIDILNNEKNKNRKSINGIKLMKFEKDILLRNYSFNSLNSYKHKNFIDKYINSDEENKSDDDDLNISH